MSRSISSALTEFVKSIPGNYCLAYNGNLLTAREKTLRDALHATKLTDLEAVRLLEAESRTADGYLLMLLGVRIAIRAVRERDAAAYRGGLVPFLGGALHGVDYRDVLVLLAVLERCGSLLGVFLEPELMPLMVESESKSTGDTIEAYFRRAPEMRTVRTMGVWESGNGETLTFR